MKKLILGMASLAMLVGCTPSVEQINKTAKAIGYAAGLVANQTKIKDEARNVIVTILNEVRECVPAEGQTFAEAWEPLIKEKVAALVKEGKIDAIVGDIATSVSLMAAKGIDYLFDIRFPEAKKYEELVAAGASGAIDGFLTMFKPANGARDAMSVEYDKEAFEHFQKTWK